MLTDFRVILILFIQCCSVALLSYALFFAFWVIKKWNKNSYTEQQLVLERNNYLVGTVVQVICVVQTLLLLLFLDTVNSHLTKVIKGAMCATGVLSIGNGGFELLFWKVIGVFVSAIFWFVNQWDNSEPAYPLTPQKYYLILPIFLWIGVDLVGTFLFFNALKPDIIATCCSVDFIDHQQLTLSYQTKGTFLPMALSIWITVGIIWMITYWGSNFKIFILKRFQFILPFFLALFGIWGSIYTLQHFFVKYIYGLPSHTCLFDMFLGHYFFIGYPLFGAYFGWLLSTMALGMNGFLQIYLQKPQFDFQNQLRRYAFIFATISYAIPLLYWWFWEGDL